MKRTMATKMIVMSNEFRTRGSMPGAIRSEIITRSSAWAAMHHLQKSRYAGDLSTRGRGPATFVREVGHSLSRRNCEIVGEISRRAHFVSRRFKLGIVLAVSVIGFAVYFGTATSARSNGLYKI